ncbi:MAG: hypothetical protein ACE5PT_05985 [Gemmatimonadales bacterium]
MATYELRAMSVGEILDGALAIYRVHFGTLVAVVVVCQGVPAIMNVYVVLGGGVAQHPVTALAAVLLSGLGGLIAAGATIWIISEVYLGEDPTMGDALGFAFGKVWRIFVAGLAKYLLIGLAFGVPFLVASAMLAFALQSPVLVLAAALLVPVGMVMAVVLAAGYAVVTQAVVLEDLPAATDALGRSWALTKGAKGRAILLGIVVLVLVFLPFMIAGAVAATVPWTETTADVGAQLLSLMVYPINPCVFTLFYYDLRVRKEGFDLAHLSERLSGGFERPIT